MSSRVVVTTSSLERFAARFFTTLTVVIFVASLLLFAGVIFDPLKVQPHFRDLKRAEDVVTFQNWIREYLASPAALRTGISSDMMQIGLSKSGCALQTERCSIPSDGCINLRQIVPDITLDLPQDPQFGNKDKTGYAVVFIPPDIVKVVACHAETHTIEEGSANAKEAAAYAEDQKNKQ
jgi:hypothetical protein